MRENQFTVRAAEALQGAHECATRAGHTHVEPLHLLLSLIDESGGNGGNVVVPILEKVGVQVDRLRQIAEAELARRPRATACPERSDTSRSEDTPPISTTTLRRIRPSSL